MVEPRMIPPNVAHPVDQADATPAGPEWGTRLGMPDGIGPQLDFCPKHPDGRQSQRGCTSAREHTT